MKLMEKTMNWLFSEEERKILVPLLSAIIVGAGLCIIISTYIARERDRALKQEVEHIIEINESKMRALEEEMMLILEVPLE